MNRRRHPPRQKDLTDRLLADQEDVDRIDHVERFSKRSAGAEQRKIEQTSLLRLAEGEVGLDLESLPLGEVTQVFSLFSRVEHGSGPRLCVVRKTLSRLSDTTIVVGDVVRFRDSGQVDEAGQQEAVIEQILPRRTILTRADSFKAIVQQPIVANARQMLIVASLVQPRIKWGLIDRMIVAALAGGLEPVFCLNKADLIEDRRKRSDAGQRRVQEERDNWKSEARDRHLELNPDATGDDELDDAGVAADASAEALPSHEEILAYYERLGVVTLRTSVKTGLGLDRLREVLKDKITVLAGHSGVGKSSLIGAIQPGLDIRTGALSNYTGKGRHVTSSARRYPLDIGGAVIDTPGVKLFGLWNVTRENLNTYYPDVAAGTAPTWRIESRQRVFESLPEPGWGQ